MPSRLTGHRSRLALLALLVGIAVLLVAAPTAPADVFTPESGGSPNANDVDTLYKIVLYIAIPIFLLVEGTLIYTLVRYRQRREGPEPAQIRGNTPLEIGWTVGAALILVVIGTITFIYLGDIKNPPPSQTGGLASGVEVASIDQPSPPAGGGKTLEIGVNGQQYLWRYDYPGDQIYSYYKLVVPVNTTVVLKIRSSDVAHSWWIPKLGGKADAVPPHVNKTWFRISKKGTYKGQCAELCGEGHADMRAEVEAVSPADYQAFVSAQQQQIKDSQTGLSAQRKQGEGQ